MNPDDKDPIETLDEPLVTWEQVVYLALGAGAACGVALLVLGVWFALKGMV